MSQHFEFDERVVVCTTSRTQQMGVAGWRGRVVGKSFEDDDPLGTVLAYAVAMDEAGGRTWMVEPGLERGSPSYPV